MSKRFATPLAIGLIATSGIIAAGLCFIVPSMATSANKKIANSLPESGAIQYLENIKNKDYQAIYESIDLLGTNLNSEQTLITQFETMLASYDPNSFTVVESDNENTFHLVSDGIIVHDLYVNQVNDQWIATPVFNTASNYIIEISSGSLLTINGKEVSNDYLTNKKIPATIMDGISNEKYSDVALMDQYTIDHLYGIDSISVDGQACTLVQDVVSKIYYCGQPIQDAKIEQFIFNSGKVIASYPAKEGGVGAVANVCLQDSDFYQAYRTMENTWFTAHNSAAFAKENLISLIDIGNNNLLAQMSMDYKISSNSGSKNYLIGFQMALYPTSSTSYKIAGFGIDSNLNENYQGVSYD